MTSSEDSNLKEATKMFANLPPEQRKLLFIVFATLFQNDFVDTIHYLSTKTIESVIISKIRAHCLRSCTAEHCNNCALREFGIAHKKIKEGGSDK